MGGFDYFDPGVTYDKDAVNNPSHYTQGKVEAIEAIESALSLDEYRGFLKGQVLKYVWRAGKKGENKAAEDLAKAEFYLKRLQKLGSL
jgi:hypothetical protein